MGPRAPICLSTYLPSPAIATGDSSALARSSSLVNDLRRRRSLLSIYIGGTVGTRGRRQAVRILRGALDMRMNGSHSGRGRRRILTGRRVWVVCGGRRIRSRRIL